MEFLEAMGTLTLKAERYTGRENLYQKSGETSEGDDDIHGFSDDSLRCLLSYCILLKSL